MTAPGLAIKAGTAMKLGALNILRVLSYRMARRLGVGAAHVRPVPVPAGNFFETAAPSAEIWPQPPHVEPLRYFGWKTVELAPGACPDWFLNPFNGQRFAGANRPWHELPDFDEGFGDIKCAWELSRWDWVMWLAQHERYGAGAGAWRRLNLWLSDWLKHNPPYMGPNWKCGQEASIRVMHLALAARLLGQIHSPSPALRALLEVHLRRIAPTIHYAVAQDNNHGTSEAAALFIGGNWLAATGNGAARHWADLGRKWLEDRVAHLVMTDGSFSQYSVNYHRLLLDTLSVCELWRRELELPAFSPRYGERAAAATHWLHHMVQPESGGAPNLGANDGACLLPLTSTDTQDYRPSVQLAAALFLSARAYGPGPSDELLRWLKVPEPKESLPGPSSRWFEQGGYAVLRVGRVAAYLRGARFRFRPSQADALHLDLWRDGVNLLRDGGSFSYAAPEQARYFSGTASHNTVQFDGRDQMPRLSRFLFGAWLETSSPAAIATDSSDSSFEASYRDWQGARHRREVRLAEHRLAVTDHLAGFRHRAVLRWRLAPGPWSLEGNRLLSGPLSITVTATGGICKLRVVEGFESRYYHQMTPLPVLEAEVEGPCQLTTVVEWA